MSKRDDIVVEAVRALTKSEFGATAIKVELEANIDRHSDVDDMHEDILERLGELGWSEKNEYDNWSVKAPLVYADTYNDGSVDTELTFTLSLADPKEVLKLPRALEIFKEVCEDHGRCFEIGNAGMHLALLNDKDCKYDPDNFDRLKAYEGMRFKNFSQSMIRLLPALYFLGSWNGQSRQLQYRQPQIRSCNVPTNHRYDPDSEKYSAIAFRHGAVEFRLFETCYDKPEAILDNLVVMSNAMKFWTRAYTPNGLQKMPNKVAFGHDNGSELKRLYTMGQHIDLLNAGLKLLKPQYYTVNELKQQRNFDVTKASLRKGRQQVRLDAQKQYEKYEKQYKWRIVYEEQDSIRSYLEHYAFTSRNVDDSVDEVLKAAKGKAKEVVKYFKKQKLGKRKFVQEKIKESTLGEGRYILDEYEKPKREKAIRPVNLQERLNSIDSLYNPGTVSLASARAWRTTFDETTEASTELPF